MQTFNIQLQNYNQSLPISVYFGIPSHGPEVLDVDYTITANSELVFQKDLSHFKSGYTIFIVVKQNEIEIYREYHLVN